MPAQPCLKLWRGTPDLPAQCASRVDPNRARSGPASWAGRPKWIRSRSEVCGAVCVWVRFGPLLGPVRFTVASVNFYPLRSTSVHFIQSPTSSMRPAFAVPAYLFAYLRCEVLTWRGREHTSHRPTPTCDDYMY